MCLYLQGWLPQPIDKIFINSLMIICNTKCSQVFQSESQLEFVFLASSAKFWFYLHWFYYHPYYTTYLNKPGWMLQRTITSIRIFCVFSKLSWFWPIGCKFNQNWYGWLIFPCKLILMGEKYLVKKKYRKVTCAAVTLSGY